MKKKELKSKKMKDCDCPGCDCGEPCDGDCMTAKKSKYNKR